MDGQANGLVPEAAWEAIARELVRQKVKRYTFAEDQLVAAIERASVNGDEGLRDLVEGDCFRHWSRLVVEMQRTLEQLHAGTAGAEQ
jgi:hypothetical protein